jgi:hypothetical protein
MLQIAPMGIEVVSAVVLALNENEESSILLQGEIG